MKSWLACAVALVHLCAPASTLPHPLPRAQGTNADLPNNDDRVPVSKAGAVLGGTALFGLGVAAGASVQRGHVQKLQQTNEQSQVKIQEMVQHRERMEQHLDPPDILIKSTFNDRLQQWEVPPKILADAVLMECIYEYLGARVGATLYTGTPQLANAISHCAFFHNVRSGETWYTKMSPTGEVQMRRSARRTTAWAEKEGRGKEVAKAAERGELGRLRFSQFSAQPLAGLSRVPHWANQVEISAKRTFAAVAARARHLPAYYSHLMQKEGPLLKKDAAAAATAAY
ncbi:MAG: hypothetical protein M1826_003740 [Phylliscum demangeonii]|nr:MAG: hypothetical protein M1826_003740 [Phylliscum demangeonii]